MKVLIVRTSSMGDLIHTYPALTELVRHYPNIEIGWLAEENFAEIPALHPAVGEVIPIAWRRWRRSLATPTTWRAFGQLKQRLAGGGWDVVVDLQGLLKSAWPARWAKAPLAGYDRRSIREPLASWLYDKAYAVSWQLSAVERCRSLLGQAFGYQPSGVAEFGIRAPERLSWLPQRYAALLHATSKASKEWPEPHWVALGQRLLADGIVSVLPWGSAPEQARAERLARQIPQAIAAPKLTLTDAAALLGHASAVIGVDTGLTHLANALNQPLVAIYTDTDPRATGVVESARACNLGGVNQCPDVEQVWAALQTCRSAL